MAGRVPCTQDKRFRAVQTGAGAIGQAAQESSCDKRACADITTTEVEAGGLERGQR